MVEGLLLASYGLGTGGAVGNFLWDLEQAGVFAYVLPFLLIFALIYAILSNINLLGSNRGVNFVLSLAVALMALQFNFVSYFFAEIFPRMGVLLSIIMVAIILMGLFFDFKDDKQNWVKITAGILVAIGFIVIVIQSFDWFGGGYFFGFGGSWWFYFEQYFLTVLGFVAFIIVFLAIVFGGGKRESEEAKLRKKLRKIEAN